MIVPVSHKLSSGKSLAANDQLVTPIITAYTKNVAASEKIIKPAAFLGEKSNSSAACGILSKPTYAHGAIEVTPKS